MQKTILCYGDSNTWGYVPLRVDGGNVPIKRYPRHIRWPGALQNLLGNDFYVVEEGLNGRATNLDHKFPPDRNGKTYLAPCLYTHAPIDLVILALGGNDLKKYFNRSAEGVRDGLLELIEIIQSSNYGHDLQSPPQILLITPPMMLPVAEKILDENGEPLFQGAGEKAGKLLQYYSDISKEKSCYFLDISKTVSPSEMDGLHFDEVGHAKLTQIIFEKIKEIL